MSFEFSEEFFVDVRSENFAALGGESDRSCSADAC